MNKFPQTTNSLRDLSPQSYSTAYVRNSDSFKPPTKHDN